MPGNGNCDGSRSLESIPLAALESGQSVCLGASTPNISDRQNSNHKVVPGSDRSVDMDATPPPLGVKLTGYRLVFMATVLSFGTVKTILTYMGQSIAPTTLDWVAGTILTGVLYWIGLYEGSNIWQWFFQVDYAPAIGYCAKCMFGTVLWQFFCFHNLLPFWSLNLLLTGVVANVQHIVDADSVPIAIAGAFGMALLTVLLWLGVGRFNIRRVQGLRGWWSAVGFVNIYGPGAPRVEGYEWFGAVGTIVGFLCGSALLFFPWAVSSVLFNPFV